MYELCIVNMEGSRYRVFICLSFALLEVDTENIHARTDQSIYMGTFDKNSYVLLIS